MFSKHSFTLDVDHFQFYLVDRYLGAKADKSALWDDVPVTQRVAVMPGLVAVSTAGFSGRTTITLMVQDTRPSLKVDDWDSVVECGIQLPSGEAVLLSPESDFEQCPHLQIAPGKYGALVVFEAITGVDELATEGPDSYHLVLWGPVDTDFSITTLK